MGAGQILLSPFSHTGMGKLRHSKVMQLVQSLGPPRDGPVGLEPLDSLPSALPQAVYGRESKG